MRRQAKAAAATAAATQAAQVATEKANEVKPAAKKVRAKAILARQADVKGEPTATEYKAAAAKLNNKRKMLVAKHRLDDTFSMLVEQQRLKKQEENRAVAQRAHATAPRRGRALVATGVTQDFGGRASWFLQ